MPYGKLHNQYLNLSHICSLFQPGSIQLAGRAVKPPIPADADSLALVPDRLDIYPSSRPDA